MRAKRFRTKQGCRVRGASACLFLHQKRGDWNSFFIGLLWIVLVSFSVLIVHANASKLNRAMEDVAPLGSMLLAMTALIWISVLFMWLKNIYYWDDKGGTWGAYVVLFLLVLLAGLGYSQRDKLVDQLIETFNTLGISSTPPSTLQNRIPPATTPLKQKVTAPARDISRTPRQYAVKKPAPITPPPPQVETTPESVLQHPEEAPPPRLDTTQQEKPPSQEPEPSSSTFSAIEQAVLHYTNVERNAQGLSSLTWDSDLGVIAWEHSKDMVDRQFFSHDNPDGETPTDRAKRYGYETRKELGNGVYSEGVAENIGRLPTGNVEGIGFVEDVPNTIAKFQVQSWMNSPGHRANILNPQYTHLGVGVALDGVHYTFTQNFF